VTEIVDFARLWFHENMRIFHDRLINEEDRIYLKKLLKSYFKIDNGEEYVEEN